MKDDKKHSILLYSSLFTGLILCTASFYTPLLLKKTANYNAFKTQSSYITHQIQENIKNSLNILYPLRSLFKSSDQVTYKDFSSFSFELIEKYPSIVALEWIPYVPFSQRQHYEEEARKIAKNFTFFGIDSSNKQRISPKKKFYLPIFYIEPFKKNSDAWGFDISTSPPRLEAYNKARDQNVLTMTPLVELDHKDRHTKGMLAFLPLYSPKSHLTTAGQKQRAFLGCVAGAYTFHNFIAEVFKDPDLVESIQIFLKLDNIQVYPASPRPIAKMHFSKSFELGQKNWTILCAPKQGYFSTSPPLSSYVLAIIFATGTVCLCIFIRKLEVSRKNVETEKNSALKANAFKKRAIRMLSHDFKNPLNAINGFVTLLEEEAENKDLELFQHIKLSIEHLAQLVNSTTDLAQIDDGEIKILPEKCDLKQLIKTSLDIIRFEREGKSLEILCEYDKKPLEIVTDPNKIRQVIINFLSNAIKYTDEGKITITIDKAPREVSIHIKDTGRGIPKESLEKIFDAYSQADLNLDEKSLGSGLGLWISKKIIEACNGTVSVESELEKGSTFTITLPLLV